MKGEKFSVLFVCLGNICRSPLAEGIFRELVRKRKLAARYHVDSCGTGAWHVGESPHPESVAVARSHGIDIANQRARRLSKKDFSSFDLIVAMDRTNRRDIEQMARGKCEVPIVCLREYDTHKDSLNVPDPYYEGGFSGVFDIIERCCTALLDSLEKGKSK